ncbi:MAG: DUF4249 domain-containing protein [Lentimicrobium sp.]|nr:DUF4249 domain-containing protein [Lentimicrobium sp.]
MKYASFNLYLFLLILMFAASCEKETSWDLQNMTGDFVVVDGTITNELKTQQIRLSKPFANPNEKPEPVIGAEILVSTSDKVYSFIEDASSPGYYNSAEEFEGKAGKTYSLLINYNNRIISAKASHPQGAEFIFLRYARQKDTQLFRITWVANAYNAKRPAMYEILLDWSLVPGYENLDPDSTKARLLYYTLPTLDVSQIFAPAMESVLFPPGTIITERRYSLTSEHAEYIRALLSETNWQGGLFNSAPANLPTNLSNNGIGYFGACAVTSKTEIARNIFNINILEGE